MSEQPADGITLADGTERPHDSVGARTRTPMWAPLRVRNFRFLWLGEAISMLGDQAYFVALPWLVLQISGDALAMSTVLALAGVPRAIFMLLGGALTDRQSPRTIMLVSNLLRMVLVATMAALVFTQSMALWMIYGFALVFGLIDAFFWPASLAIVPQLLPPSMLQGANALVQGTAQTSLLLGPVLAGFAIGALGGQTGAAAGDAAAGLRGIAVVLAFDALTFLASAVTLWLLRVPRTASVADTGADEKQDSVLRALREGLVAAWQDVSLRTFILIVAAINFLVTGPIDVGIPVLADARLAQGATAFGIIMSALGGGALVGMLLAGSLPRPAPRRFGPLLLTIVSLLGVGLIVLAFTTRTWMGAVAGFGMGVSSGYVNILYITWLQTYVPSSLMGRIMSLAMFAGVGLTPPAMILSGALAAWNLTAFFCIAGTLLVIITLWCATLPEVREIGLQEWGKGRIEE